MKTGYKTFIEFCNLEGKVDHTMTHWNILTDGEIEELKEEQKNNMPDYAIYVYDIDNNGVKRIRKAIKAIIEI